MKQSASVVAKDSTRIRLHMPLERFGLLEGVFHGVVEHFVSATAGLVALLHVEAPRRMFFSTKTC